jgi:hypothetical protein
MLNNPLQIGARRLTLGNHVEREDTETRRRGEPVRWLVAAGAVYGIGRYVLLS